MTSAVETMAYAGQVPWHGLGTNVDNTLSPEQMAQTAGIDWGVEKRPLFYDKNGKKAKVPGKFGLVRDTDDELLSIVGATYKPVQNGEAMDFFKKFVEAGHMDMETAGSLWGGKYIWGLARLGKDFTLGKDKADEVRGFLLLSQPHVHGKAMTIQFTPIRVVCWNTLTFALGSDLKGKAGAFRMPHSQEFDEAMKKSAEIALGLAGEQMDEFKQAATMLSKKKAKAAQVEEFFCEVLKFEPEKARKTKKDKVVEPSKLPMFRAALEHAPGQQMPSALGTWWGALNAVTYVVDHELGKSRDTALKNAWIGHLAGVKKRALNIAIDKAA